MSDAEVKMNPGEIVIECPHCKTRYGNRQRCSGCHDDEKFLDQAAIAIIGAWYANEDTTANHKEMAKVSYDTAQALLDEKKKRWAR